MRYETPAPPADVGEADGLAYSLWLPEGDPWAGLVILHGAGSCKESHHDFARAARSAGLAAVCFDQRGHGDTGGELDGRVLDDVATIAALLGDLPLALRGSSMGGYLAILAAEHLGARAAVAICPASADGLSRGLRGGELDFPADIPSLEAFLAEHPLDAAVERLADCRCCSCTPRATSVSRSRTRASWRGVAPDPRSELVVVPGGHHRSVQHDAELQGHALRWLRRVMLSGRHHPRSNPRGWVERGSETERRVLEGVARSRRALQRPVPGVARPSAARPSGTEGSFVTRSSLPVRRRRRRT